MLLLISAIGFRPQIQRQLTGNADESAWRAAMQQWVSDHSGDLDTVSELLSDHWDDWVSFQQKIGGYLNQYEIVQWGAEQETAFAKWLDQQLEDSFGDKWKAVRRLIDAYANAPAVHWLLSHNTGESGQQLEAPWSNMFLIWLFELSPPELGKWDKDPQTGFDRVVITDPRFIRDLMNHPPHLVLEERIAKHYPTVHGLLDGRKRNPEDFTENGLNLVRSHYALVKNLEEYGKFGWAGSHPYRTNVISGFVGSYTHQLKDVVIDPEKHTVTLNYLWGNNSGLDSAFRVGRQEAKQWHILRGGEDDNKEVSVHRVDDIARGQYGLGGTLIQEYRAKMVYPYDPSTGIIDWAEGKLVIPKKYKRYSEPTHYVSQQNEGERSKRPMLPESPSGDIPPQASASRIDHDSGKADHAWHVERHRIQQYERTRQERGR